MSGSFGLYLPSSKELPTTVTELIAIATAANIGNHPNNPTPSKGTKAPPATGINPVLYAKAQKRFCLIFETVFLPNSSDIATSRTSPFINIIPPVSLATSVPDPIVYPSLLSLTLVHH